MAWGERPTATLNFVLVDESGSKSNFGLDVPQTTLADVALTAAAALRPLIEAITDCSVLAYSLTYSSFDDDPPPAAAGSRVERKGTFVFRTGAGKTVRYQVPGIAQSVITPGGRIDEDRPAIQAFVQALIRADAIFTDSNGVDLRSLSAAYERFRSTTRRMLPSPRTPDSDVLPEVVDPTP